MFPPLIFASTANSPLDYFFSALKNVVLNGLWFSDYAAWQAIEEKIER